MLRWKYGKKYHNTRSVITLKYVGDFDKLTYLTVILWNKSQVKQKQKVPFLLKQM